MSLYETISIIISSIGLISIIIMVISLILSIHSSNRLRKSKAAEAVTSYIESTTGIISFSVWIVSSFSEEQCKNLHELKEVVVDTKELDRICYICPHRKFCRVSASQELCKPQNSGIALHKDIRYYIRDNVLIYLNHLECILLNWELGVVDQKIIEKELSFLERMDKEYKGLETMRSLIGGASAYPAIEKYYTFLKKKHCK